MESAGIGARWSLHDLASRGRKRRIAATDFAGNWQNVLGELLRPIDIPLVVLAPSSKFTTELHGVSASSGHCGRGGLRP